MGFQITMMTAMTIMMRHMTERLKFLEMVWMKTVMVSKMRSTLRAARHFISTVMAMA